MKESIVKVRQYLLSGVSFAIPFIACGGIMIATAIALNTRYGKGGPSKMTALTPSWVSSSSSNIGVAAFTLMPVILSRHTFRQRDRRQAGARRRRRRRGWLATNLGTGGTSRSPARRTPSAPASLARSSTGLIAGYVGPLALKQLKLPKFMRPDHADPDHPGRLGSTVVGDR